MDNLKELLKRGYSLRDAIRKVGVGWKTYYQYENMRTRRLRSFPAKEKDEKTNRKMVPHKIDATTLFILLWTISRHTAKQLLIRKRRRQLYAREFNQFRKIAGQLIMKWSHELAQTSFNH